MLVIDIQYLLDKNKCYEYLVGLFHPEGLKCPKCRCKLPEGQHPHKYSSEHLPSYRCRNCGCVFNIFSYTVLKGIRFGVVTIVMMVRGFLEGKTTMHLSKELKVSYNNLLDWRHVLQEVAFGNRDRSKLPDDAVESDEVFINAGEKGIEHPLPEDPPRVRANKKKAWGHLQTTAHPSRG
ncbi:MAG: IS1 family transposase [Chloroflexi bacterium]|nr:IS1 family transposase [Chloroflexota bacterium]